MNAVLKMKDAQSATVVLTGSTGSLGSYLLNSLLSQSHVQKVICLNRAEDGRARQEQASKSRGLSTQWDEDRVTFLQVDLSQPLFGLTREQYSQLLYETTHVIHNQWPVNFNWDLSSFEPYIRGVRHLLDFCLDSRREVEFLFVSTIGTVSQVQTDGPVAERPNHELSPHLGGYSASKLVCELIVEAHVKTTSHKKAAICRVGQIAGPVMNDSGMWSKQEWLPTIVASSKHIGFLPSTLGAMDAVNWVPVDILSEAILELSGVVHSPEAPGKPFPVINGITKSIRKAPGSDQSSGVSIYHAVNPHAISWAELVPTVAKLVGIDSEHIVSWSEWVDALRRSGQTSSDLDLNPGLKLLDFFESLGGHGKEHDGAVMPSLATEVSTAKSKTLASLKPVGTQWMALWLKQWRL